MKILHYSLGLPPFRSGGLTKYSIDLIKEQAESGYNVSLLYPGSMINNSTTKIVKNRNFNKVLVYELINPLPVALLDGVREPEIYYKKRDRVYFYNWLLKNKFDILHVHTLMGLPYELIDAADALNIKIIYVTHDYYGICPKVNFINKNNEICNDNTQYDKCKECCENGFSYKKIMIMQSKPYRLMKATDIGRKIITIAKWRSKVNSNNSICNNEKAKKSCDIMKYKKYMELSQYYKNIFEKVDLFHFNSNITKHIFERYLNEINGKVIPITHSDIIDNRVMRNYDNNKLRILFLGNELPYKGLQLVIDSLQLIDKSKWELNIYGTDIRKIDNNINFYGKYNQKDLKDIFDRNDIVIVPSIWYETFSLVALEAYSYAMPIIMTELVGFKDMIVNNENGFIVKPCKEDLSNLILYLIENVDVLKKVNNNILNDKFTLQQKMHVKEILKLYEEVIGDKKWS